MLEFSLLDLTLVIIAILTIAAAITSLEAKEIVYGTVSLGAMFLGIAGIFILLEATYVAMWQISVYIGAIVVLILFTIMVVPLEQWRHQIKRPTYEWAVPLVITSMLLTFVSLSFVTSGLFEVSSQPWSWSIEELALLIFQDYGVALLILGLILTSALMGALTLIKKEESD